MKYFLDSEFIEDGKTIDLISIALVKENGDAYYAVFDSYDESKASDWVKQNVLCWINKETQVRKSRETIRGEILAFIGSDTPEFWGYYADYDWVALCQLFGKMIDLPKGWPMYCNDLKQALGDAIVEPQHPGTEHNAVLDALWIRKTYIRQVERNFDV